jgi:hypothetical protein
MSRNNWLRPLLFVDVEDMDIAVDATNRPIRGRLIMCLATMQYQEACINKFQ